MKTEINWGYAYNQWKFSWQDFARVDDNLRALKVTAACGFPAIELSAGTGPWNPLGRPESILMAFGSTAKFLIALKDCGIERISSTFYDPNQMSFEEFHHGLMQTRREDHAGILAIARIHARVSGGGRRQLPGREAPALFFRRRRAERGALASGGGLLESGG